MVAQSRVQGPHLGLCNHTQSPGSLDGKKPYQNKSTNQNQTEPLQHAAYTNSLVPGPQVLELPGNGQVEHSPTDPLGTHLGDIAADTADVADAADAAGDGGDTDGGIPQIQSHFCKGSKRHLGSEPAHRLSPTAGDWLWLGCLPHTSCPSSEH